MGLNYLFFSDDCLVERVSRSLLGTAEPEGSPVKLTRFFRPRGRAARATGRGRGRDSQWAGSRSIPSRPSRAAPRSAVRGRRENGPPVEKLSLIHI